MNTSTLAANPPLTEQQEAAGNISATLRARGFRWLQRYPWLPAGASLFSGAALALSLGLKSNLPYTFSAAFALALCTFVWGYWKQAVRRKLFPPLAHLHRRQYATVWDQLASSREEACAAAAGRKKDEAEFRESAAVTTRNLLDLARIQSSDQVLEVGCGVGRIGEAIASHCSSWTGADISANMLHHASARLANVTNVRLVRLRRLGLSEFDDSSFDVVYFTNMLMHLDEMDRWQYVEEAVRVLRPGGRLFMDIIDIESAAGWTMFTHDVNRYKQLERPPYMPRFSTATELTTYLERAGFEQVRVHRRSPLAIITGVKLPGE